MTELPLCNLRFHVIRQTRRRRDGLAVLDQPLDVELDRLGDVLLYLVDRLTGADTAGQVRNVRAVIRIRLLDDDRVPHGVYFNPACLRMLFKVPGFRSWPMLPGTVTRPFFVGCLYWR